MSCSSEVTSSSSRSGNSMREPSRSAARCVATACRRKRSGAASHSGRALEEVEGLGGADQRLDAGRREHLDRLRDAAHPAAPVGVLVGEPHDGDHERHVGLDRRHHVAHRGLVLAHQAQHPLARLGERRERFQRLEGGRQAAPVSLVVLPDRWAASWPRRPWSDRLGCLASRRLALPCCSCAIANARIGRMRAGS